MWGPFIGLFPFFLSSSSTLAFFSLSDQNQVHAGQLLHPRLAEVASPARAQKLARPQPVLEATLPVCLLELTRPCPPPDVAPRAALIGALLALPTAHLHQSLPRLYLPLEHATLQIRDPIVCPIKCCLCCIERRLHPIEVHRSRGAIKLGRLEAIKLGRLGARTPLFFSSSIGSSSFIPPSSYLS